MRSSRCSHEADRQPAELRGDAAGTARAPRMSSAAHLRDVDGVLRRARRAAPRPPARPRSRRPGPAPPAVDAPRCGVTTTFGQPEDRRPTVYGSDGNTSSAAPATWPERSAATSASRSTRSPRAAFTIRTPGFISASRSASIRCRVSAVSGACSVTKSACSEQRPRATPTSTWSSRQRSARHERVEGDHAHPERPGAGGDQLADAAEADDRRASCRPARRRRSACAPSGPATSAACACGMLRAIASSSPSACSAAATMFEPGALATMMPRRGGGVDVDVVDAGAGPADHLQPAGVLEQLGRRRSWRCARSARRRRRCARPGRPAAGSARRRPRNCLAQELDAGGGDLLGDEDARSSGREHLDRARDARAGLRWPVARARQGELERRRGRSRCRTRSCSPCGRCAGSGPRSWPWPPASTMPWRSRSTL